MASKTREVLSYFEQNAEAISSNSLAQKLEISLGVLEGILEYWVRKGELREVSVDANQCHHCSVQKACPFVIGTPRYYERVHADKAETGCHCGRCQK